MQTCFVLSTSPYDFSAIMVRKFYNQATKLLVDTKFDSKGE